MKLRAFLAFELPGTLKEVIRKVSGDLQKTPLAAKWVRVDHIHLTVIFLGDIEDSMIDLIDRAARKTCAGYAPFEIALKGMGCFPNHKRARVLWLGIEGDLPAMNGFQKDLQKGLRPLNIKEEERDFKPHLTLGRFRDPGSRGPLLDQALQQYRDLSSPKVALTELKLFKSVLKPDGAEYTGLKSWRLAL